MRKTDHIQKKWTIHPLNCIWYWIHSAIQMRHKRGITHVEHSIQINQLLLIYSRQFTYGTSVSVFGCIFSWTSLTKPFLEDVNLSISDSSNIYDDLSDVSIRTQALLLIESSEIKHIWNKRKSWNKCLDDQMISHALSWRIILHWNNVFRRKTF